MKELTTCSSNMLGRSTISMLLLTYWCQMLFSGDPALGLQETAGLAWTRLGAWRALKFTDDSEVRVCSMCGNFEDEFHILRGCENLECWRNNILPESFLNSGRGNLACWELMVIPDNWLNIGTVLDNQSINQSQCSAQRQVFHCKLSILHSTLFSAFLFVYSYSPFIIMLSII